MPQSAKKKHGIDVIVDTNIIRTLPTVLFLSSRKFKEDLEKLKEIADINLCVPAAVVEELVIQKTLAFQTSHEAYVKAGKTLKALMKFEPAPAPDLENARNAIRSCVEEDGKKSGYTILPTKLSDTAWTNINEAALWKKGAFGKNDPSALKDAIICSVAVEYAKTVKDRSVVFLTGDQNASELQLFSKEDLTKLICLPSIEALRPLIKNLDQVHATKLVTVRNLAANLFTIYSGRSPYFEWDLENKFNGITGRTPDKFTHLTTTALILYPGNDIYQMYPPFRETIVSTEVVSDSGDDVFEFETKIQRTFNDIEDSNHWSATVKTALFELRVAWSAKFKNNDLIDQKLLDISVEKSPVTQNTFSRPNLYNSSPTGLYTSNGEPFLYTPSFHTGASNLTSTPNSILNTSLLSGSMNFNNLNIGSQSGINVLHTKATI